MSSIKQGNEYFKAQALFRKLQNEEEVVATELLHAYLREQGMSEEWTTRALEHIDVNHDNELTWAEFATKGIRVIEQLELHEETVLKPRAQGQFKFSPRGSVGETIVDAPLSSVEQLPNGELLLETKQESFVAVASGVQDPAFAAAAAAAFHEQTKAELIKEVKEQKQPKFEIGDQPTWAGTDDCVPQSADFVPTILREAVTSLNTRGYAIVELPQEFSDTYSDFHSAFEAFSQTTIDHKQRYASQQFDVNVHSPNQYHGFSVVDGLKEQFMMRMCGKGTQLKFPGSYHAGNYSSTEDMGKVGLKLYEQLDQMCRKIAHDAVKKLGIPTKKVDYILDPVHHIGKPIERDSDNPDYCHSSYVPDNFVSSSIMDNFHYYNNFDKQKQEENGGERFHNNHSAHTDSGLLTVVVVTDEPGLEVFDQQLQKWVALEKHLHDYAKTARIPHRSFATIFWGDSVTYIQKNGPLQPCLHRVGKSQKERYSVVFKQRTSVLTTPCRYQEDYNLREVQEHATKHLASQGFTYVMRHPLVLGAASMALAMAVGTIFRAKLL